MAKPVVTVLIHGMATNNQMEMMAGEQMMMSAQMAGAQLNQAIAIEMWKEQGLWQNQWLPY